MQGRMALARFEFFAVAIVVLMERRLAQGDVGSSPTKKLQHAGHI